MAMSWVYISFLSVSLLSAILTGRGAELSAAVVSGAQNGITTSVSIAGSICLWTGIGKLLEYAGIVEKLSGLIKPVLNLLFPESRTDPRLRGALSGNICANLLGLGNAATPMGIQAARRLVDPSAPQRATNSLCRLIVLNTASIQLIPGNVAALRSSLGSSTPFDILPAVWVTSLCSAAAGLCAAWLFGKLWHRA